MLDEGLKKTSNRFIYISNQIEIDEKTFASDLRDAAREDDENVALEALH